MDLSSLARSTRFERAGRAMAQMGVVLPLLLIGHSKFAAFEVEALKPLIGGTPWLAWMYAVSSPVGVARVLGVIEIATAFLLTASPWMPRAGVVGGALGALTFCVTVSVLAALPIWDAGWGGWPALNGVGSFLIKDVALLGISLVVFGESAARLRDNDPRTPPVTHVSTPSTEDVMPTTASSRAFTWMIAGLGAGFGRQRFTRRCASRSSSPCWRTSTPRLKTGCAKPMRRTPDRSGGVIAHHEHRCLTGDCHAEDHRCATGLARRIHRGPERGARLGEFLGGPV